VYWLVHYIVQCALNNLLQYIVFLAIDGIFKVLLQHEALLQSRTWHYFLAEGGLLALVAGSIRYTMSLSPLLLWLLSVCNLLYGLLRIWFGQSDIVSVVRRVLSALGATCLFLYGQWHHWWRQQPPHPDLQVDQPVWQNRPAQSGTCVATPRFGSNNRLTATNATASTNQVLAWQPAPADTGSVIGNLCMRLVGRQQQQQQQHDQHELLWHRYRPIGFVNLGSSNSCFMNACLQILFSSERFLAALRSCGRNRSASPSHEAVLDALQTLADRRHRLQQQSRIGGGGGGTENNRLDLLDTQQLRRSLAQICPLIQPLGLPQQQQDAAEFFDLLLDVLFEASRSGSSGSGYGLSDAALWTPSLERLSRAYPDLDLMRSADSRLRLLDSAKLEVTYAHQPASIQAGLENRACSASLLRLANLHWLHRRLGECRSPLAALIEGQMIDLTLCESCHRLRAACNELRALLVPLPMATQVGGIDVEPVSLSDCLSRCVGQLESLGGLKCNFCAASDDSPLDGRHGYRQVHPSQQHHLQRRMTSTPVAAGGLLSPFHPATPIQRGQLYQKCQLFGRLPRLLTLQLMRSVPAGGGNSHLSLAKNERQVRIPIRLDCSMLLLSEHSAADDDAGAGSSTGHLYRLIGVLLHHGSGSATSGHYTALCRCSDRWYHCDDQSVTDCDNIERILASPTVASTAYLIIYELE
ncbi:hypothetical protein BOX15_Mlig033831g3, partial [Macrostomum lignano]